MTLLNGMNIVASTVLKVCCRTFRNKPVQMNVMLMSTKSSRLKGKKHSSQQWLMRQINDPYVKRAKLESWRCRSAFKLIEIDDKHKVFQPGDVVIDCGAAPGSWSQVTVKRVNALREDETKEVGRVISIDLQPMAPIKGAKLLEQSDFTSKETQAKILDILQGKKASSVISDMAPNATGHAFMDQELILELCVEALKFAQVVLAPGGSFLCKLWQTGPNQKQLENAMKNIFHSVRIVKPPASRGDSAELFLLAKKYKSFQEAC